MKKVNHLILIGHILLTIPFVMLLLLVYYTNQANTTVLGIIFVLGWVYWSKITPKYKYYCINKINTKEEYYEWMHRGIDTFLFWPNNFFLTKTEYWQDKKLIHYNELVNNLK